MAFSTHFSALKGSPGSFLSQSERLVSRINLPLLQIHVNTMKTFTSVITELKKSGKAFSLKTLHREHRVPERVLTRHFGLVIVGRGGTEFENCSRSVAIVGFSACSSSNCNISSYQEVIQ